MKYLPLVARIALALVFLNAGIKHLIGFSGFADMIGQTLPLAPLLAIGTIVFQLLGAASLIFGYKVKVGATLLILFLIPATLVYHNPLLDGAELTAFLKNLGLIGGLLLLLDTGAGAASVDNQTNQTVQPREMTSSGR